MIIESAGVVDSHGTKQWNTAIGLWDSKAKLKFTYMYIDSPS